MRSALRAGEEPGRAQLVRQSAAATGPGSATDAARATP